MRVLIILISVSILFSTPSFSALSSLERELAANIALQKENQIALLKKIVAINSGTTNIAGVIKVGKILEKEFNQLGFKTTWVKLPSAMQRAPTLIAERHGHIGKRLLLIGHLDTVFAPNSPFKQMTIEGDFVKGPGVSDMKGGDVVMLYALKALHDKHLLNDASITVVLTGDEEDAGQPSAISRKTLLDAAHSSDIALDFESAVSKNTLSICRRGIGNWVLETTGTEAHSSQIFKEHVGNGGIFNLAYILNEFREQLKGYRHFTFNPGIIIGGTHAQFNQKTSNAYVFGKKNVVAKTALAYGEYRYLTEDEKTAAKNIMQNIASLPLAGTASKLSFQDQVPSMPPTKNNMHLLQMYSEVSKDLNYGDVVPLDPSLRGAGDISYIAHLVQANAVGLGVIGSGEHSEQETMTLSSLTMQTQRAAVLMCRLISEPSC